MEHSPPSKAELSVNKTAPNVLWLVRSSGLNPTNPRGDTMYVQKVLEAALISIILTTVILVIEVEYQNELIIGLFSGSLTYKIGKLWISNRQASRKEPET